MRINLLGGPGVGKSTTAAWLFSELKMRDYSVEHCGEYVKAWAYQKRPVYKFDQVYLFGKQQQYEYRYLSNGVKNIVTDSPCLLSIVYSYYNNYNRMGESIKQLCAEYDSDYPCFNVILDRGGKTYIQDGRWQTPEQAKEVDNLIENVAFDIYPNNTIKLSYLERNVLLEKILQVID